MQWTGTKSQRKERAQAVKPKVRVSGEKESKFDHKWAKQAYTLKKQRILIEQRQETFNKKNSQAICKLLAFECYETRQNLTVPFTRFSPLRDVGFSQRKVKTQILFSRNCLQPGLELSAPRPNFLSAHFQFSYLRVFCCLHNSLIFQFLLQNCWGVFSMTSNSTFFYSYRLSCNTGQMWNACVRGWRRSSEWLLRSGTWEPRTHQNNNSLWLVTLDCARSQRHLVSPQENSVVQIFSVYGIAKIISFRTNCLRVTQWNKSLAFGGTGRGPYGSFLFSFLFFNQRRGWIWHGHYSCLSPKRK